MMTAPQSSQFGAVNRGWCGFRSHILILAPIPLGMLSPLPNYAGENFRLPEGRPCLGELEDAWKGEELKEEARRLQRFLIKLGYLAYYTLLPSRTITFIIIQTSAWIRTVQIMIQLEHNRFNHYIILS